MAISKCWVLISDHNDWHARWACWSTCSACARRWRRPPPRTRTSPCSRNTRPEVLQLYKVDVKQLGFTNKNIDSTYFILSDINSAPPTNSPWCKLRHLDDEICERRFQDICRLLGDAECADLVLDRLLELFHQSRDAEYVYIMNWMCTG